MQQGYHATYAFLHSLSSNRHSPGQLKIISGDITPVNNNKTLKECRKTDVNLTIILKWVIKKHIFAIYNSFKLIQYYTR
jgi:hypothetical protein